MTFENLLKACYLGEMPSVLTQDNITGTVIQINDSKSEGTEGYQYCVVRTTSGNERVYSEGSKITGSYDLNDLRLVEPFDKNVFLKNYALLRILFNEAAKTWHPILYYHNPFPGGFNEENVNSKMIRFRSKGHYTQGFATRNDAVKHVFEKKETLIKQGYTVLTEIEYDCEWDGIEVPTDHHLVPFPKNVG